MPDQVRHDGFGTFYEIVKIGWEQWGTLNAFSLDTMKPHYLKYPSQDGFFLITCLTFRFQMVD